MRVFVTAAVISAAFIVLGAGQAAAVQSLSLAGGPIRLQVKPGGTEAFQLRVAATPGSRVSFRGCGLFTDEAGRVVFLEKTAGDWRPDGWLLGAPQGITVPASGRAVLPFHLAVPSSAEPGTHSSALLFTAEQPGRPSRLAFRLRIGTRLVVDVPGPAGAALEIASAGYAPATIGVTVTAVIMNAGRRSFVPSVSASAGASAGILSLNARQPELLPGERRLFSGHTGPLSPGRWTLLITASAAGLHAERIITVNIPGRNSAGPQPLFGVLGLMTALEQTSRRRRARKCGLSRGEAKLDEEEVRT